MREAGFHQAPLGTPLTAVVELELEELREVVAVWGTVAACLVGELTVAGAHRGQPQLVGLGRDEGVDRHVQLGLHD